MYCFTLKNFQLKHSIINQVRRENSLIEIDVINKQHYKDERKKVKMKFFFYIRWFTRAKHERLHLWMHINIFRGGGTNARDQNLPSKDILWSYLKRFGT